METKNNNNIKLEKKIENVFDNMSFNEQYNMDIWITIVVILVVVLIALYYFILNSVKSNRPVWEANKCNPFLMPFASIINSEDGSFDSKYTENNMKTCFNDWSKNITDDIQNPLTDIFNLFSGVLSSLSTLASSFMQNLLHLANVLLGLFLEFIKRLFVIFEKNVTIIGAINDFIAHVLGFIAILYYKLILVVDSIKLVFPMMALAFLTGVVVPSIVAVVIAIVILMVFYAICPIPIIGLVACPMIAPSIVIVIILTIYSLLMLTLYIIFASACTGALKDILRDLSEAKDNPSSMPRPPSGPPGF